MKFFLTLACATAMAVAATGALGQPTPGATGGGALAPAQTTPPPPNDGTTQYAPGRATSDTNKMGISGPESPVDSDAPNVAACRTITAQEERDKCLAQARQVEREKKAAAPGTPAASGATKP